MGNRSKARTSEPLAIGPAPTRRELGRRLGELREAAGYYDRRAFAESIGLKHKTYNNYEYGTANPPYRVLWAMADKLGVTIDELVGHGSERDRDVVAKLREGRLERERAVEVAARAARPTASETDVLEAVYVLSRKALHIGRTPRGAGRG